MSTKSRHDGPWSPLAAPAFRMLWIATVVSNLGTWMQTVGSQWILVDQPDAATWVALVQAAMTLPMGLFAFPAGLLADMTDKRRMLIAVQIFQVMTSIGLALWVFTGSIPPAALVLFTFALGFGQSLTQTPYMSVTNELVPRHQLPMAAALSGVSTNIGRAVGPALAGFAIAWFGTGLVFALNALSYVWFLVALIVWKRNKVEKLRTRLDLRIATAETLEFLRGSHQMRNLIIRVAAFSIPSQAVWAMLPIFANQKLGLNSSQYGVLLAMLGIGSVLAAAAIPGLRRALGTNRLIGWSFALYALILVLMIPTTSYEVAIMLMLGAGFGWIGVLSGLSGPVQFALTEGMRARGLASYLVVQFGCNALGAFIWGQVTQHSGLTTSYAVAAMLMTLGISLTLLRPIRDEELLAD